MAIKLPPNIQKKLLKEAKANNGRISAKDYNAIVGDSAKNSDSKQNLNLDFSFEIELFLEKNEVKFTLYGRHLSTNVTNSLHFRNKLKYKSAIKKAVRTYFSVNKKKVGIKNPCNTVVLFPTAYNPKSRDDDGNSVTLKILRDLITEMGYVKDDNRKYLTQEKCSEVLQKEYKIEVVLSCRD